MPSVAGGVHRSGHGSSPLPSSLPWPSLLGQLLPVNAGDSGTAVASIEAVVGRAVSGKAREKAAMFRRHLNSHPQPPSFFGQPCHHRRQCRREKGMLMRGLVASLLQGRVLEDMHWWVVFSRVASQVAE